MPWLEEQPLSEPHVVHEVSPSLAAIYEVVTGRLFLESHAVRSARFPTWIELFGHLGGVDGNRDLEPEEIISYDVAARWHPPYAGLRMRLARWASTITSACAWSLCRRRSR